MSPWSCTDVQAEILMVAAAIPRHTQLFQMLQEQGYGVQWVTSAYSVQEILNRLTPALILLGDDLDLDSCSLCQVLVEQRQNQVPAVLFLVANPTPSLIGSLYQAGAADYLSFPYQPEEIFARIDQQLLMAQLQHRIQHQDQQLRQIVVEVQGLESSLNRVNQELAVVSASDPLTGLPNRQRLEDVINQQWRKSTRERILWGDSTQATVSLMLVKIDQFESYQKNIILEKHSPLFGAITAKLQNGIHRPADFLAYFGNGIFCLLLPNTPQNGAMKVMERLQAQLTAEQFTFSPQHPITFSFAIVSAIPSQGLSGEVLLQSAIETLLTAIAQGPQKVGIDHF